MSENLMTIPLCQLKRAKLNVRKTDRNADIGQLAASIEAHGLLENLVVRKTSSPEEGETPSFEVIAGGRRLKALQLLAKRKKLAADFAVPCLVCEEGDMRTMVELSLAENFGHAALHPADQFEAFSKLRREGMSDSDIAARFGLPLIQVRQRLKLAAVSPRLMAEYRAGAMTLDQLMAFTVSDDHEAQEAAWFDNPYRDQSPEALRRLLTKTLVEGGDRRARFIGLKAYEAAGGTVVRDLFSEETDGYLADSDLLDRLVMEKLEKEGERLSAEGWGFVEVLPEIDHAYLGRFGRKPGVEAPLSEEAQARLSELAERYDELVQSLEEEPNEADAGELDRITAEMEALETRTVTWPDELKKECGVILSLDRDGMLLTIEGLTRPAAKEVVQLDGEGLGDRPARKRTGPYSDALLLDLSAHRTAALQEMLAASPRLALMLLLHALVPAIVHGHPKDSAIGIRGSRCDLSAVKSSAGKSLAAEKLHARREAWRERLPTHAGLWTWLAEAENADIFELLAFCVAATFDAVHRKTEAREGAILEAELLAEALSLDMADWWQPTRETFFDHVTKDEILKAVGEVQSPSAAKYLAELKKPDMALRAEELMKGSRWLPAPLRGTSATPSTEETDLVAAGE